MGTGTLQHHIYLGSPYGVLGGSTAGRGNTGSPIVPTLNYVRIMVIKTVKLAGFC